MSLAAGTQIGHYRVLSLLGRGGMGEVYLAEDLNLGRRAALKILPPAVTLDERRLRRFRQEARSASALNHPNILTVYEVGESDGRHYIATEYIEGETLRERMRRGAVELRAAVEIGAQAAAALAKAHQAGIVHRDIKPENLMVDHEGHLKVLDFGLATQVAASPALHGATKNLTTPGKIVGTVNYMSPEQARGLACDRRTDLWSLGVVLYEMVSGRAPFDGPTSSDAIGAILLLDPEPLSGPAHEVPAKLQEIIGKALRKDLGARYQSAAEMAEDLKLLLRQLDSAEWPGTLPGTVSRDSANGREAYSWSAEKAANRARPTVAISRGISGTEHRRRGAPVAFVLLALGLLAALGLAGWQLLARRAGERAAAAPFTSFQSMRITRLTTTGSARDAAISPDGRYVVYVTDQGGTQSLWLRHLNTSSNVQIVAPAAVRYAGLTFSRDGDYIFYVMGVRNTPASLYRIPVLGGPSQRLIDGVNSPVSFSPDGRRLAFVRADVNRGEDALIVAGVDGSDEQKLVVRQGPESISSGGPAWSPDGRRLAFGVGRANEMTVSQVDLAGGTERPMTAQRWFRVERLAWLAGGEGVILLATPQAKFFYQIWRVAAATGEAQRITNDLNNYTGISLTADSRALVTVKTEQLSNIWVTRVEGGTVEQLTTGIGKFDGGNGLAWTPDNRLIYQSTAGGDEDLWIMNGDGGDQKQLTSGSRVNWQPAVSPDGSRVVFLSDRTGVPHLWEMTTDGRNLRQLTGGHGENNPAFSPDGRWLVYSGSLSGKQVIWKQALDAGDAPVKLTDTWSIRPAVSPDGALIAYWFREGAGDEPWRIGVIPFAGGPPVRVFDVPPTASRRGFFGSYFFRVRWTPDGQGLVYIDEVNGVSNLWVQPFDGRPRKPLTAFSTGQIFDFGWSPDGKRIAAARGAEMSDVILLDDFNEKK